MYEKINQAFVDSKKKSPLSKSPPLIKPLKSDGPPLRNLLLSFVTVARRIVIGNFAHSDVGLKNLRKENYPRNQVEKACDQDQTLKSDERLFVTNILSFVTVAGKIVIENLATRIWSEVSLLDSMLVDGTVLICGVAQMMCAVGKKMVFFVVRKFTTTIQCMLKVTEELMSIQMVKYATSLSRESIMDINENWKEIIQGIKLKGMRPGVALKPGTPIEEVYPLVESENPVEMVLLMTVEPGFGGQKFMPEMMDKVDGGLGPSTIDAAAAAGANCIVAGSSVFGAEEPAQVISALRKSVEGAQQSK
ncbi:Ribulose-phosphate 3-epimerase, cytoplasmic isoform [Dendrobium catenatum]|uniref:Ribulose-phosphate 3-epimerase, cytoplasmic isoform n=1 Tax=Dendrobium catenatum TaxID=906689 RepID=A0A2I0WUX6_9ASPA|nr:Ribulose-phosphate 3-epimerase, cytoplasmic isoform [Dendrobium catenatum]